MKIENYILKILSLIGFIILFHSYAFSQARPMLTWNAVPGASGYRVEVADTNRNILISETVSVSSITLNIRPGTYLARVTSLNVFGKHSVLGDWFTFIVAVSSTPVFNSASPNTVDSENRRTTISIHGHNFMNRSSARLLHNGREIENQTHRFVSDSRIDITFIPSNNLIGDLDLIIRNPEVEPLRVPNAVKIVEKYKFDSISPSIVRNANGPTLFRIFGEKFTSDITVEISGNGLIALPENVRFISSEEIEFVFDPEKMTAGKYNITLLGGGTGITVRNRLTITKLTGVSATIGMNYDYLLSPWNQTINNTLIAPEMSLGFQPAFLETVPVLRFFGIETHLAFVKQFGNKNPIESNFTMRSLMLGGGLFFKYEIPFIPFTAFILRGGGGLNFLDVIDIENGQLPFGYSTTNYYYGGAALRFNIFYKMFMEIGGNYQSVLTKPTFDINPRINSVKSFVKFGIYF